MYGRRTSGFLRWSAAALSVALTPVPAIAADDVTMTVDALTNASAAQETQLRVNGSSGRYNRVDGRQINLSLSLNAQMRADADDRKIVTSELHLKSDDKVAVRAFDGTAPQSELSLDQTFSFAVDANSAVARDAIAACNAQIEGAPPSATAS